MGLCRSRCVRQTVLGMVHAAPTNMASTLARAIWDGLGQYATRPAALTTAMEMVCALVGTAYAMRVGSATAVVNQDVPTIALGMATASRRNASARPGLRDPLVHSSRSSTRRSHSSWLKHPQGTHRGQWKEKRPPCHSGYCRHPNARTTATSVARVVLTENASVQQGMVVKHANHTVQMSALTRASAWKEPVCALLATLATTARTKGAAMGMAPVTTQAPASVIQAGLETSAMCN
mmetsp:Transcript_26545/g.61991  ORF Transcript_26545/g.61991 Transcript_26545/m.61991 type:complete len:235 (+) Transcript_26545:1276-1980(+)